VQKIIWWGVVLCPVLCIDGWLLRAGAGEKTSRVELQVGEQRLLHIPGLGKIVVGQSAIADVKVTGPEDVVLYGVSPGSTTVNLFRAKAARETWEVTVVSGKVEEFSRKCQELLGAPCVGISVVEAGGKLVLRGAVRDLEMYHRVRMIRRAFPELVVMVDVEPAILDSLVAVINDELARAGLRAKMTRVGKKLLLEGTVADEHEKRRVEAIVEGIYEAALGDDASDR